MKKIHGIQRPWENAASMEATQRRSLFNYIGVAILIFGMAAGELIYWHGLQNPTLPDDPDSPYNSRIYEQTIERTVGVFGIVTDKLGRAAAYLEEPRPLAIVICVTSMLAAGGCFLYASRLPRE